MLRLIDEYLNKITMYRLVLYYLIALICVAIILSLFHVLSLSPLSIVFSSLFLVAVCWVANAVFAKVFNVPANVESLYISALILTLIIPPATSTAGFVFLAWAAIWAMASKYIFAIGEKHLFNPAAFAVALTAFTIGQSANWWVGTASMLPAVILGGLLMARKIKRSDLVLSFLAVALFTVFVLGVIKGTALIDIAKQVFLYSPLFFFAFVMLTEPLTTPPKRRLRIIYGALTGFLFAPQIHITGIYSTPELALMIGNLFSYLIGPKQKLLLKLKEKIQVAPGVYDLIFSSNKKPAFEPGQYFEWTLGHHHPDSRGNRRYFTAASSPTEKNLSIGVKFYPNSSSFKSRLAEMKEGEQIVASQLAGDFVLPKDMKQKCVFLAGGIGVTPFRSMIKYLLDTGQKRPIVLFYSNRTAQDVAYKEIFDEAQVKLGIKTVYAISENAPPDWKGRVGFINETMIKEEVPDFLNCVFYISGPHAMVTAFQDTLSKMGVSRLQIKTDFFPGYA